MNIIISGQIRGGKNHMQVNSRTGRHYPKREWALWRDQAVAQVRSQIGASKPMFIAPLALVVYYTPSDNRRRDATALLDSIFHVLERAMLVKDDSLFKAVHWIECAVNKNSAGVKMTIGPSNGYIRIEWGSSP